MSSPTSMSRTPRQRLVAAVAGASAFASTVAGVAGLPQPAQAATAPNQDLLNDWGQTKAEVDQEVNVIVDADTRVIAARTRYINALSTYASIKKVQTAARTSYAKALKTSSKTDDAIYRSRLLTVNNRVFAAAKEVAASQLAMVKIVSAVDGAVRAHHYVQAPVVALPTAPTGLATIGSSGQVSLSWGAVPGATGYHVYRDGRMIATTVFASYLDTGLDNGIPYQYTVLATNAGGWSPMSAPLDGMPSAAAPSAPFDVMATPQDASISLVWTAVPTATGYEVYRDGSLVGTPTLPSFVDVGLSNATTYTYTVKALNGTAASPASTATPAIPVATAPAAPTNVVATPGNATVQLTWTAPAGATGYAVFRNGSQIATTTTTLYTDNSVTNGTTYSYYVVAFKQNSAASATSATVTAKPVAPPLSTPVGLTATAGDTSVALSWGAVSGATSYDVYRNSVKVASSATTSYTDTGLTNGTSYSYYVIATNSTQTSSASTTISATPQPAPPAAPTGLSGTGGDLQVSLTWTAVSGATSYNVYRNGTKVGSSATASYVDTGLTNGTSYAYRVTAVKSGIEGAASATINATPSVVTPAVPTGLVATAGNAQVTLSWGASVNAQSYKVFRNGVQVGAPTATTYTDTTVTNGVTYAYTVAAVNGSATSAQSTSVSATPTPPPLSTPTGLAATPGDTTVSLAWTAVAGATSYDVYRGGVKVTTVATTSFSDTGLANGTTYSYYVIAKNATQTSTASATVTATPAASAPGAPTGLSGTAGDLQVSLTWTAVSGASSYNVYRGGVLVGSPSTTNYVDTGLANGTSYSYYVTAMKSGIESAASTTINVTPSVITPGVPTGLVATAGNAQVSLSWTPSANAQSYKVFRNGVQFATPVGTTVTDLGVVNGTTYTYTVAAVNGSATSAQSTSVSATPAPPPLSTPTGLSATPGDTTMALSWTAVAGATSYDVYRGAVKLTTVATTTYADSGLTNGTAYSYYVIAKNATQTSAASTTVTATPQAAPPAAPTGLSGTGGDLQVSLTWTAVSGATSYNVYRGGVKIASPTTTSYTDLGRVNGTSYAYYVTAVKGALESTPSSTINVTPTVITPAAPTGVVATPGNAQVSLSWTASANATGYKVYRGGVLVSTQTGTSFLDTGLTNGTAYSYTVVATNGSASSAASTAVSATPMAPAPAAPTGLTATAGNAQVSLSWTAVPTATSYKVYRGGVLVTTVTTTSYVNTGLTNGTPYTFYVTAVAATTEGPASTSVVSTPAKPPVNGTFTGAITSIASGHGTIQVVIVVTNSVITSSKGTLLTNDGTETVNINKTALPQYDTKAVAANSANITKVSGASLTWTAYKTSLQSALTLAGL